MSDIQTPVPNAHVPEPMAEIVIRLGDLGLAPENLRYDEPADKLTVSPELDEHLKLVIPTPRSKSKTFR